jgi:hypothetical protein
LGGVSRESWPASARSQDGELRPKLGDVPEHTNV